MEDSIENSIELIYGIKRNARENNVKIFNESSIELVNGIKVVNINKTIDNFDVVDCPGEDLNRVYRSISPTTLIIRKRVVNFDDYYDYNYYRLQRRCDIIKNIKVYPETCEVSLENNSKQINMDQLLICATPYCDLILKLKNCKILTYDEYYFNEDIRYNLIKLSSEKYVRYGNGIYHGGALFQIQS
jgi:hypothetical protein